MPLRSTLNLCKVYHRLELAEGTTITKPCFESHLQTYVGYAPYILNVVIWNFNTEILSTRVLCYMLFKAWMETNCCYQDGDLKMESER